MTLVTEMEKRNMKFSVSSCFNPLSAPLQGSLLFCLFCDAHWAPPATVEGSGNGICSLGRFLRTGFPHLWGPGPSVDVCVCVPSVHIAVVCPWPGGEGACAWGQGGHYGQAPPPLRGGVLAMSGLHNRCTTAWWRARRPRLELRSSGPTPSSLAPSLSEPQFLIFKMGLITCPVRLPTGL